MCLDQCPVTVSVPGYGDTFSHRHIIPHQRSCHRESEYTQLMSCYTMQQYCVYVVCQG